MKKGVNNIRRIAFLFVLLILSGISVTADIYCPWWKLVDDSMLFEHEAICIKTVEAGEIPTVYVITDFSWCVTKDPVSDGKYELCNCGDDGCGDPLSSGIWYDAGAGGPLEGAGIGGVYLPVSDAYFPFLLLVGVYGFTIYRKRKSKATA